MPASASAIPRSCWSMKCPNTARLDRKRSGDRRSIHLYVEDVESVAARAVRLGAKTIMPVSDMFWGDRYGQIEDPFGHRWSIATHIRDVAPAEMQKAMQSMCTQQRAAQPA